MFLRFPAVSLDFTRLSEVRIDLKRLNFRCVGDNMSRERRENCGNGGTGLMARRPVLLAAMFALSALVCAGPATAASPQRIYKDLADNGRLDGNYSRADIARALNLQQVVKTDRSVSLPATRRTAAVPATPTPRASTGRVPFTSLDVVLLLVGGGPLLLIGIGLRRRLAVSHRPEMIGS